MSKVPKCPRYAKGTLWLRNVLGVEGGGDIRGDVETHRLREKNIDRMMRPWSSGLINMSTKISFLFGFSKVFSTTRMLFSIVTIFIFIRSIYRAITWHQGALQNAVFSRGL